MQRLPNPSSFILLLVNGGHHLKQSGKFERQRESNVFAIGNWQFHKDNAWVRALSQWALPSLSPNRPRR